MKDMRLQPYFIAFKATKLFSSLTALLFLSLFHFGQQAQAQTHDLETIDIVFDLDWTLISETTEAMAKAHPENTIRHDGHVYRFADHLTRMLRNLHQQPHVRISIFSGGDEVRNKKVVEAIYANLDYKPYKVLSLQHLKTVSNNFMLPFSERLKKDLSPYFNLKRTLIVDDTKDFVPDNQIKNELWLGKTYNDRPEYNLKSLEDPLMEKYSAPNKKEWLRDRNKLLAVEKILMKALKLARENKESFLDNINKVNFLPRSCKYYF